MLSQTPELSVVIPTFNERDNVLEVVRRLEVCLSGINWEVIFVDDDSNDGTADVVRAEARRNVRVRCLRRIGRRGLSSACVEGMMASSAPYFAVMDADCQHDERLLPEMLDVLRAGQADLVIGSRYADGGGVGRWNGSRARLSRLATSLGRAVIKCELTDPMSGFFAIRNDAFEPAVRNLSNMGFKILLDVVASSTQPMRIVEVPYEFRTRYAGESKLDGHALWDYLMLLADKLIGHVVPVRFVAFLLVGAVGVLVHFATLTTLFRGFSLPFTSSQAAATTVAIITNFALNNVLTYRDRQLHGWQWLRGLLSFALVCSLGASANIGIAAYLFGRDTVWVLAALVGIVVGAVWNYAVSAVYTWRPKRAKRQASPLGFATTVRAHSRITH